MMLNTIHTYYLISLIKKLFVHKVKKLRSGSHLGSCFYFEAAPRMLRVSTFHLDALISRSSGGCSGVDGGGGGERLEGG